MASLSYRRYDSRPCKKRKDGAPEIPFWEGKSHHERVGHPPYYLSQFRAGGELDAQPRGASPAYANYVFGVYTSAAGYTLDQALALADTYAQYRGHYPPGKPMDRPEHPFTPVVNVANITSGFNAQQNGTLCQK